MNDDDEESPSDLSERARQALERVSLRHHCVDLERVQRIHLGIDSEEMEFSAGTIAHMLQQIAEQCDEDEAFTIQVVVNALRGTDDHHVLVLQQKRRGKFVSPTKHEEKHNRNNKWLWWLGHLEKQGIKTESAVAEIAQKEGVSRATVFKGVKDAEAFQAWGRELSATAPAFQNPRPNPTKRRKA